MAAVASPREGSWSTRLGLPFRYSTGTATVPFISARSRVAVRRSASLVKTRLRATFGRSGCDVSSLESLLSAVGLSTFLWTTWPFSVSLLGRNTPSTCCLLYTSDAADDLLCVDLGGSGISKKKKKKRKKKKK